MDEIKETGGARIGMANATWPLATLIVSKDKLEIKAPIGDLVFKPGDVVSIQPYTFIPLIGQGIKIFHMVRGYDQNVIFWTMGSPAALVNRITQTGFLDNKGPVSPALAQQIETSQSKGGFPIKTPAAIAIVVIWNIFFAFDFLNFFNHAKTHSPLGTGAQLATAFVFLTGLTMLLSEPVRQLILKPGRTIDSIKGFIYLLMLITAILFLSITFFP